VNRPEDSAKKIGLGKVAGHQPNQFGAPRGRMRPRRWASIPSPTRLLSTLRRAFCRHGRAIGKGTRHSGG
jgi:hypothetical protein